MEAQGTAQTEARAIMGDTIALYHPELLDRIAAALAAKDAELSVQIEAKEHARRECDRAEAQLAEARKALEPFADIADLIDSETEGMSETDELALHFHDYLMASWPVALFRAARRVREGGRDA